MKKCKIQGQVTTVQILFTYNRKSTNFSSAYLRIGRHNSVNNFKFHSNAVGIVPNLSFCFFPFFFTDSLSVIVCEGQTKEIRCESISKTEGLLIRLAPRKLRVLLFTYKPAWTFFINGDEFAIAFVFILIRPTGNILP